MLISGHVEILRRIFPPFPVTGFTPNFTGYDLDQQDIDWYDTYLMTAPNDSLAYVRSTSFSYICHICMTKMHTSKCRPRVGRGLGLSMGWVGLRWVGLGCKITTLCGLGCVKLWLAVQTDGEKNPRFTAKLKLLIKHSSQHLIVNPVT